MKRVGTSTQKRARTVSSSKRGRPSYRSPLDVRNQLIAVGKEHFLRDGSKGLIARQAVKEAGANLGSFVYHFGTKEKFIQEIIQSHYKEFIGVFNSELEEFGSAHSPLEKLRWTLEKITAFAATQGALVFRLMHDVSQGEPEVLKAIMNRPPEHILVMTKIIAECQEKNLIRKDITPQLAYVLCVASVGFPQVFMQSAKANIKNVHAQKAIDEVLNEDFRRIRIDFALRGLAP